MFNLKKIIPIFIKSAIVLAIVLLIISIIKSAYFYQYDYDELYHVQRVYLIASGFKPYTSFFFNYTSIFHTILAPIFLFFGFSFATLAKARIFVMLLFAVRLLLSALLINKVFNRRIALLFIPLLLFDPFTIFSSMQIRPDNFMMTVYVLGLLIFVIGFFRSSKLPLFLSGMVFGLSLLTLIKIAPQLMIFFIIYGVYSILNRKLKFFILFLDGFILTLILFCIYYLFNGSFLLMFKQITASFSLSDRIANPVYYGFFHQPNNAFIYGLIGKPLTWTYVWVLPLLASAGAYLTLSNFANSERTKPENIDKKKQLIQIILIASLVVQFLFLLNLNIVFIQYYIPFQWLLALFAAVVIDDFIFKKFKSGFSHQLIKSGFFILFLVLVYVSIQANNARALFSSEYQISQFAPFWSKVPQNAAIFPSILFRPIVYPLSIGEDQFIYNKFASPAIDMFPSYVDSFEKNKVPYLVIDDSEKFYALESGLDSYVKDHYQKIDNQINLYKRVK